MDKKKAFFGSDEYREKHPGLSALTDTVSGVGIGGALGAGGGALAGTAINAILPDSSPVQIDVPGTSIRAGLLGALLGGSSGLRHNSEREERQLEERLAGYLDAEEAEDAEEALQEKVAELLSSMGPEEAKKVASAPYTKADRKMAMSLGFCDALAERGLTPSDFDVILSQKAAGFGEGAGNAAINIGTKATLALVLGAALAGNITGKGHYHLEQRLNKMDDAENVKLREKAKRLASQRDELAEDLASRPSSSLATPAAKAQKQDLVSLLD